MRIGLFLPLPRYHPDAPRWKLPTVPLGLYVLAAVCRDGGHEPVVFDPNLYPDIDDRPDLLGQALAGLDAVGVSSHTFNWPAARRLAENCRLARPDLPVIAGGVHPSHRPRRVLETSAIDYVVIGDGDTGLVELLTDLESGRGVRRPGIASRDDPDGGGKARIDQSFSLPAYDLLPADVYQTLSMETSRGCVGNCAFCSITGRRRWRPLPAGEVADRLARAVEVEGRLKGRRLYLVDDCFTVDAERAAQICAQIPRIAPGWSILLEARVQDLLKPEIAPALAGIGAVEFQIGIECGYDLGISRVGKRFTRDDVVRCMDHLDSHGLVRGAQLMFIIGLPWEGLAECTATVTFAATMADQYGCKCNLSWWRPIPSLLWNEREEYGIRCDDELFDREGWVTDPDLIPRVYPRLPAEDYERLRTTLAAYANLGVELKV